MSYNNRRTPRTYTYRIPVDDRKAIRKIHVLDALDSDYWITKLPKSKVPTAGNGRHFGCVFYQSAEHFDYDRDEMVGGAIPGLHKHRYSLDWKPCPEDSKLEMRNANGGGTKIRGERFVGTHDPRLPDYVPVETAVPWTPTEIEAMYEGEPVPDRMNYTHDAPEIPASEALEQFREELHWAEQDGLEEVEAALQEYVDNCGHDHVVKTGRSAGDIAFCEDCGRGWDRYEFRHEKDDLTVVGTA